VSRKLTAATNTARLSAAALGMLLCAIAHTTRAAAGDFADAWSAGGPLYGGLHEAAQRRPEGPQPGLSSPVEISLAGLPARFRYAFGTDPLLASDRAPGTQREVFLRSSDSLVRAKVRVRLGKEWLFAYADMAAGSSPLRWQGLVAIRVGRDAHLLGGWRRVTYDLSPGGEFDSLDFDGPFIGAQRAW